MKVANRGDCCLVETALCDGSYLRTGSEQVQKSDNYNIAVKFAENGLVGKGDGATLNDVPASNLDFLIDLAKQEFVNPSAEAV